MPGTKESRIAAARTKKAKFGEDYYAKIGAIGGRASRTGGFYADRNLAREAGRLGGTTSRRGKVASQPRRGRLSVFKYKPTTQNCTYCSEPGHTAYMCVRRRNVIAERQKLREEARKNHNNIIAKHGVVRPW